MKLVYWIAESYENSAYSIRGKRRRDVVDELIAQGFIPNSDSHGPIHKVTVEYDNAFDLLQQCLGEGGIWEGTEQEYATAVAFDQGLGRPVAGHERLRYAEIEDTDTFETLEGAAPEREYAADDPDWYTD